MPRPVHFEVHATDLERAKSFYQTVFGWEFQRWNSNPYWLIRTGEDGPGIDGGLTQRTGPEPNGETPLTAFPITIDVPDLDAYLSAVTRAGGSIVVGKSAMPSVGWLAYCRDTEGNVFGLIQNDVTAA